MDGWHCVAAAVARPNGFQGQSLKDIDRTMYPFSGDLSGAASSERERERERERNVREKRLHRLPPPFFLHTGYILRKLIGGCQVARWVFILSRITISFKS